MTFQLPRRCGKATPVAASAALTSCALISAGLLAASFPVQARPLRSTRPQVRARRAPPLAPTLTGKSATPVQTLLFRNDLPPMGAGNGVRLWVHGDGSGANLRVRVLAPTLVAAAPAAEAQPRDEWISTPMPITFTGWREFVLPQSKFSRRSAPPTPSSLDLALPAAAQPAGTSEPPVSSPDWAAANGLALDVTTSRQTTLVVDDIAWVTLDAGGQGTAATPVADFEQGNVAAWRPVGTPEEEAAVSYGLATQPGLVHGGRVAFRLTVTPPGLVRRSLRSYAQAAMSVSRRPCLVWLPTSLFARVLPDSLPLVAEASPEVTLTACPEQIAAATFCLYSPTTLMGVAVSLPQDLQGIGHTIPKSDVEVHVVGVRPQSGGGTLRDPDTAGSTPTLLVKDDRVPLAGAYTPLRLTGPAVCDIPADTTKQFWLTFSVPRNTPHGSTSPGWSYPGADWSRSRSAPS